MFKVTPNPPNGNLDLTTPLSQDAIDRAFAHYNLPPPSPHPSHGSRSLEDLLVNLHELLDAASATAYESADAQPGTSRKLSLAVVHLLELAQARINQALDHPQLLA